MYVCTYARVRTRHPVCAHVLVCDVVEKAPHVPCSGRTIAIQRMWPTSGVRPLSGLLGAYAILPNPRYYL